ncbi:MAG: helix-turn-helix transcriptional regulator [Clostridia bacterium]|nr:helix-turn-helix transcriptional regulator [Clostridia bacterium]
MKLKQLISLRTRRLLKERAWTQYKLASRGAIPFSTLSYTLNNHGKSIRMETILNICRGFDISLSDFFNDSLFAPENIADDD